MTSSLHFTHFQSPLHFYTLMFPTQSFDTIDTEGQTWPTITNVICLSKKILSHSKRMLLVGLDSTISTITMTMKTQQRFSAEINDLLGSKFTNIDTTSFYSLWASVAFCHFDVSSFDKIDTVGQTLSTITRVTFFFIKEC